MPVRIGPNGDIIREPETKGSATQRSAPTGRNIATLFTASGSPAPAPASTAGSDAHTRRPQVQQAAAPAINNRAGLTGIGLLDSLAEKLGLQEKVIVTPAVPFLGVQSFVVPQVWLVTLLGLAIVFFVLGWDRTTIFRSLALVALGVGLYVHARSVAGVPPSARR